MTFTSRPTTCLKSASRVSELVARWRAPSVRGTPSWGRQLSAQQFGAQRRCAHCHQGERGVAVKSSVEKDTEPSAVKLASPLDEANTPILSNPESERFRSRTVCTGGGTGGAPGGVTMTDGPVR